MAYLPTNKAKVTHSLEGLFSDKSSQHRSRTDSSATRSMSMSMRMTHNAFTLKQEQERQLHPYLPFLVEEIVQVLDL